MRNFALLFFILLELASFADNIKEESESNFKVVPLLTSSPLLGAGVGGAISYLYDTGEGASSKSQLRVGGQYSNTKSYNLFVNNNAYFLDNRIISTTVASFAHINNEFQAEGESIEYNARTAILSTLLMYEAYSDIYFGGYISYKNLNYNALNANGSDFLFTNGIVPESYATLGGAFSYDTRKNKYYPSDAIWISLRLDMGHESLGALNSYYASILNARYYAKGFSAGDVWAWQFFGQYSSEKTPDSALPTLSGKTVLRGFPSGQFRARYLSGLQNEYRYKIKNSKFKVVAFCGVATLQGGSYGTEGESRQDDGVYANAGAGLRYAIQAKTGVDLRLDLVTTSENQQSLYLMLNQAF